MATDPVPLPTGRPIVFYSPHQDDETLFMGQVIAHHALVGREVHVVLATNGETSGALAEINGTAPDPGWWGGYHFPTREGYAPVSRDEFGRARSREFAAASRQLGVMAANIHFGLPGQTHDNLPPRIDVAAAESLMVAWAEHFTATGRDQVGHYTMWKGDPNPHHAALGQALQNENNAHPQWFGDARWLVKPEQATAARASVYRVPAAHQANAVAMARRAARCYTAWAPAQGMYAIGRHSVPAYFAQVDRGDPNHILVVP
jgi:LmbE family N-acetylglucosaminyl deacetylase